LGKGILYFIIVVFFRLLIIVLVGIILLPIWWNIGIVDAYKTAELINQDKDASGFFTFSENCPGPDILFFVSATLRASPDCEK
jgi:hypothetical protein